jgi:hypothetical protein
MWSPSVTSASASAPRMASVTRKSHSRARALSGGTTQFEFSFPRSNAHSALCPASAPATSRASVDCARTIDASEYQLARRDAVTRPPETTRNRSSLASSPRAHKGIQFTPLMWPVKSVGMTESPAVLASSRVETRRSTIVESTEVGRDLRRVECTPPAHRRPSRPIIDAEPKGHGPGRAKVGAHAGLFDAEPPKMRR